MSKPVRATILLGMISGLALLPLSYGFMWSWRWPLILHSFVLIVFLAYSLMLGRWSQTAPSKLFFPLLVGIALVVLFASDWRGLIILAVLLGWIRSGICYQGFWFKKIVAELMSISIGVGYLIHWQPSTPAALALAAWFFFLVQALYFYVLGEYAPVRKKICNDRFEQAYQKLERIVQV